MATQYEPSKFESNMYLNTNEQDLLITALNSNKTTSNGHINASKNGATSTPKRSATNNSELSLATPERAPPGSGSLHDLGLNDSPFLDYELDEANFDWDVNDDSLVGPLPGEDGETVSPDAEGEVGDKRKNPEDDNEDDGGGKRREDGKNGKKPGRRPLTSEPTTKRKAQNRAAQRAFRERKEKHLKELEGKVDDLEKASESANHENGLLRAQVERLQAELKEYRKRLSLGASTARTSPQASYTGLSSKSNWDINNNFQFAFPKFGPLGTDPNAPLNRTNSNPATSPTSVRSSSIPQPAFTADDDINNLFSPSVLASASSRGGSQDLNTLTNGAQSLNNAAKSPECNTASPCSSVAHSMSQNGFTSSSATSPESSAESPEQRKASETATNSTTEGSKRRQSSNQEAFSSASSTNNQPNTPGLDTSFDWFANQNGGAFDPVLFGDYRDPQDNIMNSGDFGFFDSAFSNLAEFNSPPAQPHEPALPKKKDLMQQIEESQAGKTNEVVPGENTKQFLTCNMLWDRVQRSQRVQSGEADMDDLCSQLKSKAKCSGNGAVIEQRDVDAILGPAPDDTRDFFKMFK